ncbi:MAG: nucleotidyltransferase family protein [Actinomycetota bacterium]
MKVDALILAGGTLKGISGEDKISKALIEIEGKPMIEYVIDVLKDCPGIGRMVAVISSAASLGTWAQRVDRVLFKDGSLTENIEAGMEYLGGDQPILVLSSDIPLITPEAISDFLNRCSRKESRVYYPIISREDVEKSFPGVKRTYAVLKDGTFTGGNIALIDPKVIRDNRKLLERFYNLRKSPFQLARALGLRFILKFLFRMLTIAELEDKISHLIQAKGCAIITPYPEIGVDVDKDSDLELVRKILSGKEE